MNQPEKEAGFTLMELVVVMAILGILVAIAMTTIGNSSPRMRLKSDARDLVSTMQLARVGAIRDTRSWAIDFDTVNQRYRVYNDASALIADNLFRTATLNPAVSFGTSKEVTSLGFVAPASGVSFAGGTMIFNSNGSCDETGEVYLTIASGETFAIGIMGPTGNVRVWKNYGNSWQR